MCNYDNMDNVTMTLFDENVVIYIYITITWGVLW